MTDETDVNEAGKRFLAERRENYRATFNTPVGEKILEDLAQFCRANESTFHENERAHALLEGRREVWLRIEKHLKLSNEQLWQIFGERGQND